jgi:hypothetical protein
MTAPAQGNQILFGLADELRPGIRDDGATIDYFKPILPANARFGFANAPGGEVNQSGFAEKGVPGAITGPLDFGARFSVRVLFKLLRTICRDIAKSTLETGVFQYVMTPDRAIPETTLFGLFGMPPVDQMFQHGIKIGSVAINVGNNTAIPLRATGQAMHFSRLGAAIPDPANEGTGPAPVSHGPVASVAAGNVFWEITAVSPLTFKLKQATGETPPTMAGSTVNVQRYGADGQAIYIDGLQDTGAEIGIYGENRDPWRIVFPGEAADHADFEVGDVGYFPVAWALPTPTYVAGQRFTSAHQANAYSLDGGSTWVDLNTLTSAISIVDPLAVDQGSGSRYPLAIDRNGQLVPTVTFTRKLRDLAFRTVYEQALAMKLRTYFIGQLLAGGPNRESAKFDWAAMELLTLTDPAQNDNAIIETASLRGITDDAETPPFVATLITDGDYAV